MRIFRLNTFHFEGSTDSAIKFSQCGQFQGSDSLLRVVCIHKFAEGPIGLVTPKNNKTIVNNKQTLGDIISSGPKGLSFGDWYTT